MKAPPPPPKMEYRDPLLESELDWMMSHGIPDCRRHPCAPQVWSGTPLAKYFSSVGEQDRRTSHAQQLSPKMWGIPASGWLFQAIRKTAQREHLHYNAMLKAYSSLAGMFAQQTGVQRHTAAS